jgi:hypothetical protein
MDKARGHSGGIASAVMAGTRVDDTPDTDVWLYCLFTFAGSLSAMRNCTCAQHARDSTSITYGSVGIPFAFTGYTAPMQARSMSSLAR